MDGANWWVVPTLCAAVLQIWRTGLQKKMADDIDRVCATWVRYLFAIPLAIAVLSYLAVATPSLFIADIRFWLYCVMGGIAQIIATMCLLKTFNHRNFAVGTTFAQTEGIVFALLMLLLFGHNLVLIGWLGVGVSVLGVLCLARSRMGVWTKESLVVVVWGMGASLFFAFTVLFIRLSYGVMADNEVAVAGWQASAMTLSVMVIVQTLLMVPLIDRAMWWQVIRAYRLAAAVGVTSYGGSFLWFYCFYIANPTYVKTLALVELPLAFLVSRRAFNETVSRDEKKGLVLMAIAAVIVVHAAKVS